MIPLPISLLPLFLLLSLSAAQSPPLAYFALVGPGVFINATYADYFNYTLAVPRDSTPLKITNTTVVYTIIPTDSLGLPHYSTPTDYNCDFLGAQGAVTHLGSQKDVNGPQVQVSVTCFGNATSSSSGVAATSTSSGVAAGTTVFATGISSSSSPLYPTGTGSYASTAGGAAASASAGSGTGSASGGTGSGTVIPFTGDAVKAAGSVGGAFFAFVLGIVAAAV